jgi:ABC-type amino acid transport substrate-binding protein
VLVWWFERRVNPDEFEPSRHGLWSAFWFAAVSMTTVGYGDKAPRSIGGRVITLVWMFASIIVISFFTAAIATALTVHSLEAKVNGPQDLPRAKVGSVESTTSARYLEGRDLEFTSYATAADAVEALADGEVEAVVYDRPILRWLVQRRDDASLRVLAEVFDRQDYALVLAQGSPLREEINRVLLEELQSSRWPRLLEQYLGD